MSKRVDTDRRTSPRYTPVHGSAFLGWWDASGFRTIPAVILDFSLGGAFLAVDELPPAVGSVWVLPFRSPEAPWVPVRLVEVVRSRRGPHGLRVAFHETCAYQTFMAVVHGASTIGPGRRALTDEHWDSRYWR